MCAATPPEDQPTPEPALPAEAVRIRVFVPLRRWSSAQWTVGVLCLLLGVVTLAAIAYATWIGVTARRWDIGVAVLALVPWWLLLGARAWWVLKSLVRGGCPLIVGVNKHGVLALAEDDAGTVWRLFDRPTLTETADELIIENSAFSMVAKLPKVQVPPEHAELVRQSVRLMNTPAASPD